MLKIILTHYYEYSPALNDSADVDMSRNRFCPPVSACTWLSRHLPPVRAYRDWTWETAQHRQSWLRVLDSNIVTRVNTDHRDNWSCLIIALIEQTVAVGAKLWSLDLNIEAIGTVWADIGRWPNCEVLCFNSWTTQTRLTERLTRSGHLTKIYVRSWSQSQWLNFMKIEFLLI